MAKKQVKLKGKAIASRLTGTSTPIGGISWIPPVNEKDNAGRLLVFLEDRRALYEPYNMEIGGHVRVTVGVDCYSSLKGACLVKAVFSDLTRSSIGSRRKLL